MRKLCLGGTFNPIHHGHLLCGLAAMERSGFDRLVIIPSAVPPLKQMAADMASAADRHAMCMLATAGIAALEVNDVEMRRSEPSFTIDTARQLRQSGWGKVSWLVGADILPELFRWHDLPNLLREVDFVVMTRAGQAIDWQSFQPEVRHLQRSWITLPQIDISATQIRERVRAGHRIDFMTPPAVCDYIRQHGLYR